MKNGLLILTAILVSELTFGQNGNLLLGRWTAIRIEFKGNDRVVNDNKVIPTDTIAFEEINFEQKSLLLNDSNQTFLWTQKGTYETIRNRLILKGRVTSTGKPGLKYPDVEYRYKIKKGQLMLGAKPKLARVSNVCFVRKQNKPFEEFRTAEAQRRRENPN